MSRREFLRRSSAAALGAAAALGGSATSAQPGKSKVVEVASEAARAADGPSAEVVQGMLTRALRELTGEADAGRALAKFVSPQDVVGLKVNCRSAPGIVTNRLLVEAMVEACKQAGVPDNNIVIWDRFQRDLTVSGYQLNHGGQGVRVMGSEWGSSIGYDPLVFAEADPADEKGSRRSLIGNIVTKHLTKIVNLPVLKDHDRAGVTFAMKNVAYGACNNTARSHPAPHNCDPLIPEVYRLPVVRDKTVLIIGDALRGQYDGGPDFKAESQFNYGALLVSTDPVAADRIGLQILDARRGQANLDPIYGSERHPNYLLTAVKYDLGVFDPANIDHVRLTV